MATSEATLSRDGTTVTLPLRESGGTLSVSRDIGKPEAKATSQASLDPRWSDQWSQIDNYRLVGQYTSSSAYSDANTLADFIKSHSGGSATTLSIPHAEYSDVDVAPAAEQDRALSLTYDPGRTDWVGYELVLTRVSSTQGSGSQDASTPTATGTGPIKLSDGSNSVTFSANATVERVVGRPNSVIRRATADFPIYIDHRKAAYDAFELSAEFVDSSATTSASDLASIATNRLGRSALTLDFQGEFGLGSFSVVLEGSQAVRIARSTGQEGWVNTPTVSLRRVTT